MTQGLEDLDLLTKLDSRWKIEANNNIVFFDTLNNQDRRVGIGKNDPSTLLDVNGTINATGCTLNGTDFTGGTNGKGWKTGSGYNSATGVVSFLSDDGLAFSTGDLRGAKGLGFKT